MRTRHLLTALFGLILGNAAQAQFAFETVVLTGETAPGIFVAVYESFGLPAMNNSGAVSFLARVSGANDPSVTFAQYTIGPDGTTLLLARGDAIPGTSKTFDFHNSGLTPINNSGALALAPQLAPAQGGGDNALLSIDPAGNITPLVVQEDPAPGTNNRTFRNIEPPSLNNANQIAFVAATEDTSGIFTFEKALYRYDPTTGFELLAEFGQPAPLPGGGTFSPDFDDPYIGDDGTVVFESSVNNGPDGIFMADPSGTISAIVLEDVTVATPEFGGNVFSFSSTPIVNSGGDVLFDALVEVSGAVTSSNNEGLFLLDASGNLSLVMREGDAIPGNVNATFQDPDLGDQVFNNDGTFAFVAGYDEAGFPAREGLFFGDTASGPTDLLLAEGTLFEVLPGDFRTIDDIDLNTVGGAGDFIAADVDFTDGSTAIVLITIPEPTSFALLGLGGLLLCRRRRTD